MTTIKELIAQLSAVAGVLGADAPLSDRDLVVSIKNGRAEIEDEETSSLRLRLENMERERDNAWIEKGDALALLENREREISRLEAALRTAKIMAGSPETK